VIVIESQNWGGIFEFPAEVTSLIIKEVRLLTLVVLEARLGTETLAGWMICVYNDSVWILSCFFRRFSYDQAC
jgi:hypothetical protein